MNFQNTDHIFGFCSPDHSYQRTPATFAGLVGQKRIDLTAAQTSLIDTQALSQVLIKQQLVSRMRQLLPLAIIAEMLLVLGGKITQGKVVHQASPIHLRANHAIEKVLAMI